MQPSFVKSQRALALILAILVIVAPVHADVLYLRNGEERRGLVIQNDGVAVVIETATGRLQFPPAAVERVVFEGAPEGSPARRHLTDADSASRRGDARRAWEKLLEAEAAWSEGVASAPALVSGVSSKLFGEAQELLQRERYAQAEELLALLVREPGSTMLSRQLLGAPPLENLMNTGRLARGLRLVAELAGRPVVELGNATVIAQLEEAVALLPPARPEHHRARLTLGLALVESARVAEAQGNTTEARRQRDAALQNLHAVRDASAAPTSLRERALEAVANLRTIGVDFSQNVTPTPATFLTATRAPTEVPLPTLPPEVPTPTPVPPGMVERTLESISAQSREIAQNAQATFWAAAVAGVVVGWSIIPWGILRFMERSGSFAAARRRPQAWLLGWVAVGLVLLEGKSRTGGRKAQHLCPHCRGALDFPELYPDFRFSQCPHCQKPVSPVIRITDYIASLGEAIANDGENTQSALKSERMDRLVGALLSDSTRRRASDLHIEPEATGVKVRQRIDGMMTEMLTLPKAPGNALVSALKVRANLDVAERRKPQDGSLKTSVDGTQLDVRVASSPSADGEKIVLRLLDVRNVLVPLKKLGMTNSQRDIFERVLRQPHGLILVTGPTGSGKTTTLYVALQTIRSEDKNIISIEDPIEFRLPGINQIQVNPVAGLTFATGLRSILRQDPDVIMIGEIRDMEAAEIAIEAATTGHLVLSSLHTIDSASAMTRLNELGIPSSRFVDSLALIVSQRLARLVCPDCRQMRKPTDDELESFGIPPRDAGSTQFPVAKGCELCNRTGYFGRTGLYELLVPNDTIRAAFQDPRMSAAEVRNMAIASGMMTVRQHGVALLTRGLTTVDELVRTTR